MSLIRKNRSIDADSNIKEEILSFLSNTYSTSKDNQYSVYKYKDKWIVDSRRSLTVGDYNISYLTNGLFEFGDINGNFDCGRCKNLKSLKGGPKYVAGYFDCSKCKNLTSLEGAPVKVNGYFSCISCAKIINLKGSPKYAYDFYCNFCDSLISLEGGPVKVSGIFSCESCKNLKSLEGSPKYNLLFNCSNCESLRDFTYGPKKQEMDSNMTI